MLVPMISGIMGRRAIAHCRTANKIRRRDNNDICRVAGSCLPEMLLLATHHHLADALGGLADQSHDKPQQLFSGPLGRFVKFRHHRLLLLLLRLR